MNEDQVIKALAALAHPVRLSVFRALVMAGAQGLTPSVLAERLGVPATALSFHLKELMHAGLVCQERVSRNLFYRAAYDEMHLLLSYLTENCCGGDASDCAVSAAACDPFSNTRIKEGTDV